MVLTVLASLVLAAAAQAGGATVEIGFVPVVRATRPPVVDGEAEDVWSAAVKRRLDRSKGPIPQSGDV